MKPPEKQDLTEDMMNNNRAGQGEGGEVIKIKCKKCGRMIEAARHSESFRTRICARCFRKMRNEKTEEIR